MTRVEQVLQEKKDLVALLCSEVHDYVLLGKPLNFNQRIVIDALGALLKDVEAYRLLNDIRLGKTYLIDSDKGHILDVQFS